jgi:hypothetical protein
MCIVRIIVRWWTSRRRPSIEPVIDHLKAVDDELIKHSAALEEVKKSIDPLRDMFLAMQREERDQFKKESPK